MGRRRIGAVLGLLTLTAVVTRTRRRKPRDFIGVLLDLNSDRDRLQFERTLDQWHQPYCGWLSRALRANELGIVVMIDDAPAHEAWVASAAAKWPQITVVDVDALGLWQALKQRPCALLMSH